MGSYRFPYSLLCIPQNICVMNNITHKAVSLWKTHVHRKEAHPLYLKPTCSLTPELIVNSDIILLQVYYNDCEHFVITTHTYMDNSRYGIYLNKDQIVFKSIPVTLCGITLGVYMYSECNLIRPPLYCTKRKTECAFIIYFHD